MSLSVFTSVMRITLRFVKRLGFWALPHSQFPLGPITFFRFLPLFLLRFDWKPPENLLGFLKILDGSHMDSQKKSRFLGHQFGQMKGPKIFFPPKNSKFCWLIGRTTASDNWGPGFKPRWGHANFILQQFSLVFSPGGAANFPPGENKC